MSVDCIVFDVISQAMAHSIYFALYVNIQPLWLFVGDKNHVCIIQSLFWSLSFCLYLHSAFCQLLDQHFGAAMTAVKQNQLESATQHAAAVTAVLNAVVAYAEWAPVTLMANFGLIQA